MTPEEIRQNTQYWANKVDDNEVPTAARGTSAVIRMEGEIAAQLAELNQQRADIAARLLTMNLILERIANLLEASVSCELKHALLSHAGG